MFTQPLYKETKTSIVPKASKINFKDDLKNAMIKVERETIYVELAQKWKGNGLIKDIKLFESISELLNAINNGKIDAGMEDSLIIKNSLKK